MTAVPGDPLDQLPAVRSNAGHIIVSGLDHLGVRTIAELRLGEEPVVAIAADEDDAENLLRDDVRVVTGDQRRERVLRDAGVTDACALILTRNDDLGNLHTALLARELNPSLRVVLRMFDDEIAARLPDLIDNAVSLSSSALAAPGFVSAAIDGEAGERFEMAGRRFVVRADDDGELSPGARIVGVIRPDRSVELLPAGGDALPRGIPVVLEGRDVVEGMPPEEAESRNPVQRIRDRLAAPDRRLVRIGSALLVLAIVSALFFEFVAGLTPLDAASFAVGLLTGSGTGFAGVDEAGAPVALKLYGIVLSLIGAALVGVVYALITDAIIGARLLATLGRRPVPTSIRNHVIVCGLGSIGYRVALGLRLRGVRVVVVDRDESGRFVAAARAVGIPVVAGDARQAEVLRRVGVERCRAIAAVTSDDLVNLTASLNARAVRPDVRVVMRLFDPDLALRAQRGLKIRYTRSVSSLAAPAFAAASIGSEVAAAVPVGDRRVLVFACVPITAASDLPGLTVAHIDLPGERLVLGVRDAGGSTNWQPTPATELPTGGDVLIASTRRGLAALVERSRPRLPEEG